MRIILFWRCKSAEVTNCERDMHFIDFGCRQSLGTHKSRTLVLPGVSTQQIMLIDYRLSLILLLDVNSTYT